MRTIFSVCAAIAALTILVGCSGTSSYVGKWDATMSSTNPDAAAAMKAAGTMKEALELKADNSYVMTIMGQKMEGTYKVDGKAITMTPNEASGGGSVGTITASDDGNTLTSTEQGMTMTLTRSKG